MSKRRKAFLLLIIASAIVLVAGVLVYKRLDAAVALSGLPVALAQHSKELLVSGVSGLLMITVITIGLLALWLTSGPVQTALKLLEIWSVVLPPRIQREELGDFIEDINRRIAEGQRDSLIKGRALVAMFWTAINTIHYLRTQVNVPFLKRVFTTASLLAVALWVGNNILHREPVRNLTTDVTPITGTTPPSLAPTDPTALERQQSLDKRSLTKASEPQVDKLGSGLRGVKDSFDTNAIIEAPAKPMVAGAIAGNNSSNDVVPTNDVNAQPEVATIEAPTTIPPATDRRPSPTVSVTVVDGATGDSGAAIANQTPTSGPPRGSLGLMGVGR